MLKRATRLRRGVFLMIFHRNLSTLRLNGVLRAQSLQFLIELANPKSLIPAPREDLQILRIPIRIIPKCKINDVRVTGEGANGTLAVF